MAVQKYCCISLEINRFHCEHIFGKISIFDENDLVFAIKVKSSKAKLDFRKGIMNK